MKYWKDLYKDDNINTLLDETILESIETKVNTLDISKVKSEIFDMNKPVLQFQDEDNMIINICNVDDLDDGINKIKQIFKDSELEHRLHYFRVNEHEDYYWIDYGSHHTFFRVTKKG